MIIWGKLIGGVLGWFIGGPLGVLIGIILGHQFDRGLARFTGSIQFGQASAGHAQIQNVFFETTFSVMGHMAKADGRVTEQEIALARQVMAQMGLSEESRRKAIDLFTAGKQPDFDLKASLARFKATTTLARNLRLMFIEIQIYAAYADGIIHHAERHLLQQICQQLGFSAVDLERLEAMIRAQRHHAGAGGRVEQVSLDDAYAILNISSDASDAEVKRAYRRLTNQHHPDKLVAKGLPEEMMKLAEEKTREIRAAYERIKDARGF